MKMSELCKNDEFDAVGFKFRREELFEYALSAIKSHHLPGKPTFDMMTDVVANEMVSIIDMYLYMRGVNYASDIYDDADRNEYLFIWSAKNLQTFTERKTHEKVQRQTGYEDSLML
jgi:hypothetical protein